MNTFQHKYTAATGLDSFGNPCLTVAHDLNKKWTHVTVWLDAPPTAFSMQTEGMVYQLDENTVQLRLAFPVDTDGNFLYPVHVRVSA